MATTMNPFDPMAPTTATAGVPPQQSYPGGGVVPPQQQPAGGYENGAPPSGYPPQAQQQAVPGSDNPFGNAAMDPSMIGSQPPQPTPTMTSMDPYASTTTQQSSPPVPAGQPYAADNPLASTAYAQQQQQQQQQPPMNGQPAVPFAGANPYAGGASPETSSSTALVPVAQPSNSYAGLVVVDPYAHQQAAATALVPAQQQQSPWAMGAPPQAAGGGAAPAAPGGYSSFDPFAPPPPPPAPAPVAPDPVAPVVAAPPIAAPQPEPQPPQQQPPPPPPQEPLEAEQQQTPFDDDSPPPAAEPPEPAPTRSYDEPVPHTMDNDNPRPYGDEYGGQVISHDPRPEDERNATGTGPQGESPRNAYSRELARMAPPGSAPLPKAEMVRKTGFVLSRISFRTIVMKKWKQSFWVQYGPHTMLWFRSQSDFDDWLNNPYHTQAQRNFLIKLAVNFVHDLYKPNVRGYQVTQCRTKAYNNKMVRQFKLERWMDYGPTIAAAFGSYNPQEVDDVREALVECMRNTPLNGGIRATGAVRQHNHEHQPSAEEYDRHNSDRENDYPGDVDSSNNQQPVDAPSSEQQPDQPDPAEDSASEADLLDVDNWDDVPAAQPAYPQEPYAGMPPGTVPAPQQQQQQYPPQAQPPQQQQQYPGAAAGVPPPQAAQPYAAAVPGGMPAGYPPQQPQPGAYPNAIVPAGVPQAYQGAPGGAPVAPVQQHF